MSLAIRRSWTTDFNCVSFIDYAASQAHFQSRVSEEDPRRQQRRGPGGQDAASEEDPRRQRRGPGQDFQNFQPDVHQAPPQDFRYGRGNAAPSQLGGADRTVAAGARPKVSARDRGWAPPVELGHASSPFGEGLGPPPPMGSPGAAGGGRGENFALGSRRDRREDPPYMNSMDQMAPPYAGDSHGGYDAQAYGGRPAAVLQDSFNGNDARGSQGNLFGQRRQQFSHDEGPPQQQQPRWAQARGPPAVPDVPFRGSHGGRDGGYPDQGSYADRGGYPNQGGYSDRGGGYQDRGYPDQGRPDQGYDHGYPDQGQMDMRDSMQDRQMPRGPGGGGGGQQPQQRRQAGGGKAGGFPGEAFGEASIDHFRNGASRAAPHGSSPGDLWGGQGPDNASRPYGEAPSMPRGAPLSMPGRMQQDTQADAYAEDYDEPRRAENNSKGRRDPNAGSSAFSGMSLEDSLVPKRTERAVDRPPPAVEENDFFGRGNQMQAITCKYHPASQPAPFQFYLPAANVKKHQNSSNAVDKHPFPTSRNTHQHFTLVPSKPLLSYPADVDRFFETDCGGEEDRPPDVLSPGTMPQQKVKKQVYQMKQCESQLLVDSADQATFRRLVQEPSAMPRVSRRSLGSCAPKPKWLLCPWLSRKGGQLQPLSSLQKFVFGTRQKLTPPSWLPQVQVPKNEPPASYSVPTAPPVQDGEVVQSSTRGRSVCSEVSRCPQLHGDPSQRPNATGEELRHHAVKLEAWINAGRPNQSRSGSASVGVRAPSASGQSSVGAPGALGPSLSRGTGAMGSGASIGRATTRQRSIGRSKSGLASAALAAFTARGSSGATLSSLRHSSALKFAPSQRSNRRVAAQRADRTPERKCLSFAD
ncbi:unnamed protein product [Polarella glacialis]|uniref:Uncharacterized protein n=1 Tax=Polarella glacialis TaxID=89957 RepID=A0A813E944_POLGL|nr:unnamed protein product [Polarella glacialis]